MALCLCVCVCFPPCPLSKNRLRKSSQCGSKANKDSGTASVNGKMKLCVHLSSEMIKEHVIEL